MKEKCSQRLRSILGVLPCSSLRILRLWARTKNEHSMDVFSTLTIRVPWLLEKGFYFYCFRLASRRGFDATRSSRFTARDQFDRDFPKDHYEEKKGRLLKEFQSFLVRKMTSSGNFKESCSHLYLLRKFGVLSTHYFQGVIIFSKFMRCTCLCGMVLMMHVRTTRLPICVSDCKGNQK
jgi:hypothetical protein